MKTSRHLIQWVARSVSILAILFVSMFAADAFAPGLTIGEQLRDFVMHIIPSFILLGILIIAWKWELAGGIVYILAGLGLSPFIYQHNFQMNHSFWMSFGVVLMINFPFIAAGILFLISHFMVKKQVPAA